MNQKNSVEKASRRALRRARTERVVASRFETLKRFELRFKDPLTGNFRFPLPEPGTLENEGAYGGCGKARMCGCCFERKPFQARVLEQDSREAMKSL